MTNNTDMTDLDVVLDINEPFDDHGAAAAAAPSPPPSTPPSSPLHTFLERCRNQGVVVNHILSYLDAKSLLSLSTVALLSHERVITEVLKRETEAHRLWTQLQSRDFEGPDPNERDTKCTAKELYILRQHDEVARRIRKRKEEAARLRAELRELWHQNRQHDVYKWCSHAFHIYQEVLLPLAIPGAVLCVGTGAYLHLNAGDEFDLQSYFTLPLLIFVAMMTIAFVCVCYAGSVDMPIPFRDDIKDDSEAVFMDMYEALEEIRPADQQNKLFFGGLCVPLSLVGIFLCLLAFRMDNTIDWSYSIVFSPLFLMFLWNSVLYRKWWGRRDGARVGFFIMCDSWILVFVVMVVTQLEADKPTHLWHVFMPLFLWDMLALAVAVLVMVKEEFMGAILIWLVVVGPMLTFKIMISLRVDVDDSDVSWTVVFIPFWIWSGAMCIGGIGLSCYQFYDRYID